MAQKLLNSLVISGGGVTTRALEQIMAINLEGYVLSFLTIEMNDIDKIDRLPDLIFIDNDGSLQIDDAYCVRKLYPKTTCVVLSAAGEQQRADFLRAGMDEVMSLEDLQSVVGKHMVEKLIAFKDLADARIVIEQSEERFKGVIEHSNDIIVLLDADTNIIYTSPAMQRQLGYEEWEVLGQAFSNFLIEDDVAETVSVLERVALAAPTETTSMDFQFRTRDGEWRNFDGLATNLLRNSTVQAIIVNMRDVTEQKHAAAELEVYRKHLEDMVEKRTREVAEAHQNADAVVAGSPDALIAVDDEGVITFISEHYRRTYPDSAHLLVAGKHFMDAYQIVTGEIGLPKDDPRYKDMVQWWQLPKGSKEFRMNNGTWVRLQARRRTDNKGTVISTTNISDYKRQQALLARQSEELASALAKEKDIVEQQRTFVAMVSHEFRTPLAIIDGNAQIIHSRGDKVEKEVLQKRATTIRQSVERLVRLIDAILSVHMLDSGKLSAEFTPCDVAGIVREAVSDQQDISPEHRLRLTVGKTPKSLMADEKMVRQIVANLLTNAVKYSPNGGEVEINLNQSGTQMMIEVQDHGVGIPEDELPKITGKYFRASTSGGIPGTGLGLSLVKQFVDLHGGDVDIKSRVGVGTVVTVWLPVEQKMGD